MSNMRAFGKRVVSTVAPLGVATVLSVALVLFSGAAAIAAAYGPHDKVTLCHNGHEITVSRNAESAHMNHGDTLGTCP